MLPNNKLMRSKFGSDTPQSARFGVFIRLHQVRLAAASQRARRASYDRPCGTGTAPSIIDICGTGPRLACVLAGRDFLIWVWTCKLGLLTGWFRKRIDPLQVK